MAEVIQPNAGEHIDEAELARRFEEKRRLLEMAGVKTEMKQVFREAFREHVTEKMAPAPAAPPPLSTPPTPGRSPAQPMDSTQEGELRLLVALALEKGVLDAVKKAEAETPYLIDALHDELADHYYDKLIAAGKLNPE